MFDAILIELAFVLGILVPCWGVRRGLIWGTAASVLWNGLGLRFILSIQSLRVVTRKILRFSESYGVILVLLRGTGINHNCWIIPDVTHLLQRSLEITSS